MRAGLPSRGGVGCADHVIERTVKAPVVTGREELLREGMNNVDSGPD